ncbi:hypothetical protein EON66_09735 [archaeon]|nr:MAG: hypothetical protein EON66_09735 [archaeon]
MQAAHTVNATFLALNWLKQEEFGAMIAAHCFEKTDNAVGAVYALQLFMSTIGFPKGLLASIFAKLYEWDVIDEGSLRAWREDTMDRTPGKEKAITQAEAFFDWLDAPEEEESEEESDEDLMDVIKPNNATRLR